jgi:chromate reductase, NAD(P)H dehydrogenase (quinone)
MTTPRLLALDGSLRRDSFNRKLLPAAIDGARRAGAEVSQLLLRDLALPLFDEDFERASGLPEGAQRLKGEMIAHDGFLLACPEYNSSITAALKNAIDWASRATPGEPSLVAFRGKVAALMSASPGGFGGLRGLVTVRSILGNIGVLVLPDQVCVPRAHEAFDGEGRLKDEKQRAAIERLGATAAETARKLRS